MRIVIVGGVAGGMSAATRARRMNESAEIVVLEKGDYISFANCGLPYYLGGTIRSEQRLLVTTPQAVQARYAIDVRVRHEVTAIDRSVRQVAVTDLESGQRYTLGYDKLILATGATPIVPPVEHVRAPNVLLLRSMEDTQAVQRWLVEQRPARVAIVGAGFIGLEMAEAMHQRGLVVTVIEKAPHAPWPPFPRRSAAGHGAPSRSRSPPARAGASPRPSPAR
jgi:NADPH-dependent 2,4-dienoyl-CoA reductase/sulfur reductase-like enzyme